MTFSLELYASLVQLTLKYRIQFLAADAPDGRAPAPVQHELATPFATDSDVYLEILSSLGHPSDTRPRTHLQLTAG